MLFFTKNSVGIDISDDNIEVVELTKEKGKIELLNHGRVVFGSGIVERGRIKNKKKLAEVVKQALSEAKLKSILDNNVVFGLPENQVYALSFELEPHDKKEREDFVFEHLLGNVPIEEDDMVFSYKVVEEKKEGVEIIAAAVSHVVVSEWKEFFEEIGIKINVFDIESLAIFRGLMLGAEEQTSNIAIVDIGAETTHVSIFNKKGLRYSYTIDIAGDVITTEIAEALGESKEEAEETKKRLGLSKPGEKSCSAIVKVLQPVVEDVKTALAYFNDRTGEKVEKIILVGGSSGMKGLQEYVGSNVGVPVEIGKISFSHIKDSLVYLEAVGLALRGVDDKWEEKDPYFAFDKEHLIINKNKEEEIKSQKPKVKNQLSDSDPESRLRKQKKILAGMLIAGVVSLPLSFWYRARIKSTKEDEIQAIISKQEVEYQEEVITTEDGLVDYAEVAEKTEEEFATKNQQVTVTETPTGWLNVRSGPGTNFNKIKQVNPGESYELLGEEGKWYKIKISEGQEGWIINDYTEKNN